MDARIRLNSRTAGPGRCSMREAVVRPTGDVKDLGLAARGAIRTFCGARTPLTWSKLPPERWLRRRSSPRSQRQAAEADRLAEGLPEPSVMLPEILGMRAYCAPGGRAAY